MADLIGGPHDGSGFPAACRDQVGLVLGTSPDRVSADSRRAGALYGWDGERWRFERFTDAGESWRLLTFGESGVAKPSMFGWFSKVMFGESE